METKIKRTGDKYVITLELPYVEWTKEQDAAFRALAGKFKIQGFRPGKAPRSVIEKQYGADIFTDEARKRLLSRAYSEVLNENPQIKPIDSPEIEELERKECENENSDATVGEDDAISFTITVDVEPEVTPGKYTGIKIKKSDAKVGDVEIDDFLATQAKMRSRQIAADSGHKIAVGDTAVIDFAGSVDGEEFDGGTAAGHNLEIGSNSFIDNFEDQLVGHCVGERVEVNVTFPEKYHAENLSGKKALFVVDIKNILRREIPEISDTFAKEASEFDNLADWKADIRNRLNESALARVESEVKNELLKKIIEASNVEIPEKMIQMKLAEIMEDMEAQLAHQGATIEMYAEYMKMPIDKLMETQRENAVRGVKARLVLNAIIARENIEVTEDELAAKIDEIAAQYDKDAAKKFKNDAARLEWLREDLRFEKLMKWLLDNNAIN